LKKKKKNRYAAPELFQGRRYTGPEVNDINFNKKKLLLILLNFHIKF